METASRVCCFMYYFAFGLLVLFIEIVKVLMYLVSLPEISWLPDVLEADVPLVNAYDC